MSLYEAWLTANPFMRNNSDRWRIFIEAHPDLERDPSARYIEFANHYQRIHYPKLWQIQQAKSKVIQFPTNYQEQPRGKRRK